MDTKSFVRILRKVIREEVGKAVRQALTESVVTDNAVNVHELVDTPKPAKRQFVKNSMLNDILNDTAFESDFSGMHEGAQYEPDLSNMGSIRPSTAVQSLTGINGEHVDTTKPEIQAVGKALTRDYSGLMKAINKKKGIN